MRIWSRFAPWFLSIACSITLFAIGYFLIENITWFKETIFKTDSLIPNQYRIYAYHMHLSMVKRSVGLFSGFAILFLGLSVAFFTLKENTNVDVKSTSLSLTLASASPGIIVMFLGTFILTISITSKDNFPAYMDDDIPVSSEQLNQLKNIPLPDTTKTVK
jgi:hypothetical protein